MSKFILVTGAAGMIGSNLVHYLLENTDYKIIGVDNLSGGYKENLPETSARFGFLGYDILDADSLDAAFAVCKPNIVYHCAAYAAEGLSPFIRRFNYTNNVVGTAGIVNACIEHEVGRLVFFSSIAVYGSGPIPYKEYQTPSPIDSYGIAKYACELDLQAAASQHGLDSAIVRPFNIYGERQNLWDKYRNVLGIWTYNYINGLPLQIYGDGQQVRNFTYVGDILRPLEKIGVDPNFKHSVVNIGSDIPYTLNLAVNIFREVVGNKDYPVEYLPERHEVRVARASVKIYEEEVAGEDYVNTSLYKGLKKMWEWAQQQPKRERKAWDQYEITKGLYENWKT